MSAPVRLRVHRLHFPVTALGPGTRLGVWLQGCPLACAGCMSHGTWDARGGTDLAVEMLLDRWQDAQARGAEGVTISGGEPLTQPDGLTALLRGIDAMRRADAGRAGTEPDILLYTGYEPDELDEPQRAAARHADVLVSGRFRVAEPTGLIWRGSANQRMHLQTDLGRRRYTPYLDLVPGTAPLQVAAEPDGLWVVGVPRRGTLRALEHGLRSAGVAVDRVSWRNGRDHAPGPTADDA